jgi:LysR family glycine cleavage system transcriptional activator
MKDCHDCDRPAGALALPPSAALAPRWQGLPLRALVPFEAAARLGSFQRAAHELRLTPSAVSHQIIGLESSLGVALFTRIGRGIALTTQGAQYATKIHHVLSLLDDATRALVRDGQPDVVALQTPPSLASKWLLPLLPAFRAAHPGIEVRLTAAPSRAGFRWETTDLAIQYAAASAPESQAVALLEETIQPMCSPQVLRRRPIRDDADLRGHVLIHSDDNAVTWQDWFTSRDLAGGAPHDRIRIDPSHVAIEAAARGLGVVLESDVLARDELASGRLVAPLPGHAVRRRSYRLAWEPGRALAGSAALLRDWLVAAACRDTPAAQPGRITAVLARRAIRRRA